MSAPLLSVSDVHVTFAVHRTSRWPWSAPQRLKAVNAVSFDLARGQTLGIVGESGCGKSTLIRAIAGLVPLSQGQVIFDGTPMDYGSRRAMQDMRRRMQMIFQDPIAALNPRMTVREIVTEPLVFFRPDLSAEVRANTVRRMLDRVGIAEGAFNRFPHEFSGGQCQRIGIARALVAEPDVLLCDEPVSALDVSIQAQVINLLRDLQAELGLALVFVAHDLGVVRHISDEVLVLYLGAMMERGPAETLVSQPRHPYTQALLSAVPIPDPKQKIMPTLLHGDLPSPLDPPAGCPFSTRCPNRIDQCIQKRPPFADGLACLRAGETA